MRRLVIFVLSSSALFACRSKDDAATTSPPPLPAAPATPASVDAAPAARVVQVALGEGDACVRMDDGTVRCWGSNAWGQLGSGSNDYLPAPRSVPGLAHVAQIALGGTHTCALLEAGEVWCWGENGSGQLGDGTTEDRHAPVKVAGLKAKAKQIALGESHSCALLENGTVACWGSNGYGQIGDGTNHEAHAAVTVAQLKAVTQIALGAVHSCALVEEPFPRKTPPDHGVRCWGSNQWQQLGGATGTFELAPAPVRAVKHAKSIASGAFDSCAALEDGTAMCWGRDTSAQLGLGPATRAEPPSLVAGLANVARLALGPTHSCALLGDATLRCWGHATDVDAGPSVPTSAPQLPGKVLDVAVASGLRTCVVLDDGTARCWAREPGARDPDDPNAPGGVKRLAP